MTYMISIQDRVENAIIMKILGKIYRIMYFRIESNQNRVFKNGQVKMDIQNQWISRFSHSYRVGMLF